MITRKLVILFATTVTVLASCSPAAVQSLSAAVGSAIAPSSGASIAPPTAKVPSTDDSPSVDIEGIGAFKIGMTLNDFYKIYPAPKRVQVFDIEYYTSTDTVFELTPKTEKLSTTGTIINFGNFCPEGKIFSIKKYKISDLELDLGLTFYKGVLLNINNASLKLEPAIELKYGKGKKTNDIKKVSCVNKATGNTFSESEGSFLQQWQNTQKNIKATSILKSSLDSKCQSSTSYTFDVSQKDALAEYTKCNDEFKKKAEDQLKAETKKTLSDL